MLTDQEKFLVAYSFDEVLITKAILASLEPVDLDFDQQVLLFDGQNCHQERVVDFLSKNKNGYKFVEFCDQEILSVNRIKKKYDKFYKKIDLN